MTADRFKRTRWKEGMVFAVPIEDGRFCLAQAVSDYMPNVIYVSLFSNVYEEIPEQTPVLKNENIISLVATWKQNLNNGSWAKIGVAPVLVNQSQFPNEKFAQNGYVGAKNYDSGLLEDFLSAYHGITPWNVMFKENYWESLLAPGVEVPSSAEILAPEEREKYRNDMLNS